MTVGVLLLPGCRVGPDAAIVELGPRLNAAYLHAEPATDVPPAADLSVWWEGFDDPTLTALVERALTGSLDLAAARERIVAARARRGIENADRLPALDASAGYSYAQSGEEAISFNGPPPGVEADLFSLGAVAGWELDLWGRVARLVEAADAEIRFAAEDFLAVRVSLAASVAREVLTVRALDAELATVEAGIAADRDVLSIAEARGDAGFSDRLDAARARRVLAADLAELPALQGEREASLLRLAALLGRGPRRRSRSRRGRRPRPRPSSTCPRRCPTPVCPPTSCSAARRSDGPPPTWTPRPPASAPPSPSATRGSR